ncbi:hypothetical protein, partial [Bordetella bronchiseptica]|uniref:hypothetical protein n=1 Tax=Bordetella bronchiseptica TaxID=518 RepID=UPI001F2FE406
SKKKAAHGSGFFLAGLFHAVRLVVARGHLPAFDIRLPRRGFPTIGKPPRQPACAIPQPAKLVFRVAPRGRMPCVGARTSACSERGGDV